MIENFFNNRKIGLYIKMLRPQQWIKNLFIFVPIFFVKQILAAEKLIPAVWALVVFCLAASAMYIINDTLDKETDSAHPQKQRRPIASGQISVADALVSLCLLIVVASVILYVCTPSIWPVMLVYVVLNLAYSFYLKKVVIFDLIVVSVFYLLRILAGGLATNTYISHWLVLCVVFATLFMVIGKRMSEFEHLNKREVLHSYNLDILEHLLTISAGLTIVCYGLYSILGSTSPWAVYSTLFVILGVFRYLYIIHTSPQAEFPEKLVFTDRVILGSVVSWMIYMYLILYIS